MKLTEIKALIDVMAASDLSEMELTRDGTLLRMVRRQGASKADMPAAIAAAPSQAPVARAPRQAAASVTAAAPAASTEISAPLYGVVHWKPSPDAAPFVTAGQPIEAGQVVCVIEAMKVFNEVRAERAAQVLALLVEAGTEVEAGQPLLRLG